MTIEQKLKQQRLSNKVTIVECEQLLSRFQQRHKEKLFLVLSMALSGFILQKKLKRLSIVYRKSPLSGVMLLVRSAAKQGSRS